MESLRQLYRIGMGPSSSHTIGPKRAAEQFAGRFPQADLVRVRLLGSLAATGKGHLTDKAIEAGLGDIPVEIRFEPEVVLDVHPNGLIFTAFDSADQELGTWTVFSVGGGALQETRDEGETEQVYPQSTMAELLQWSVDSGEPLWRLVEQQEGPTIWPFLETIWAAMQQSIAQGLLAEGVLPGKLKLARKARNILARVRQSSVDASRTGLLSAYALAASEQNAGGGDIVTAPTCGSCGVLPACFHYLAKHREVTQQDILRALATAGLVGNVIKFNSSISGAEVGCQGEIGAACSMAAAGVAHLLGGSCFQIEYAAEMGLEHFLGLTCDPVCGLVQIPCIERNAMGALRAMNCAEYALFSDGRHRVSFDQVVRTMLQTGQHLPSLYRETAEGGLAEVYAKANV